MTTKTTQEPQPQTTESGAAPSSTYYVTNQIKDEKDDFMDKRIGLPIQSQKLSTFPLLHSLTVRSPFVKSSLTVHVGK